MVIKNLYSNISSELKEELFEDLIKSTNFKLERIVSKGQATKVGQWLTQNEDEWVILLKGNAGILFEKTNQITEMNPGDYLNIPANTNHRVEWTDSNSETVWLALHYRND